MFAIRQGLVVAGVLAATVAFSCSNEPPASEPLGGDAGAGALGSEDAGAPNRGGNAGVGASSAGDGAGGERTGAGGRASGGDGAGSGDGQGGRSDDPDDRPFTLTEPSESCEADELAAPEPPAQAPGLGLAPSSGQPCDASNEPNDAPSQACQLSLGVETETQLSSPVDATDNFVFHAEAGVSYTLTISALDCTGAPGGNYLNVSAKSLATAGQTQQLNTTLYFGERKAYEIRSNATADELITLTTGQSCQYGLAVVPSTEQGLEHDAVYEPNDTPSTAAQIEVGERISSSLSAPRDSADYFTFPARANLTYTVRVSAERCSGTPGTSYVTLKGWSLGSGTAVENLRATQAFFGKVVDMELVTTTGGEQLLQLETSQSCEYEMYVVPSAICGLGHGAGHEPNDTPSTAAEIAVGTKVMGELRLPSDAVDYYSFSVEPKTEYTLTLSAVDCVGNSSLSTLSAKLWSGRTDELPNASTVFYLGEDAKSFTFTSGSSPVELLRIGDGEPCAYELRVMKDGARR